MIGNCGVGFAPCRADAASRDAMVRLMEGVEDIPPPALTEGLPWTWETFPQYMDIAAAWRGICCRHGVQVASVIGSFGTGPCTANPLDSVWT